MSLLSSMPIGHRPLRRITGISLRGRGGPSGAAQSLPQYRSSNSYNRAAGTTECASNHRRGNFDGEFELNFCMAVEPKVMSLLSENPKTRGQVTPRQPPCQALSSAPQKRGRRRARVEGDRRRSGVARSARARLPGRQVPSRRA